MADLEVLSGGRGLGPGKVLVGRTEWEEMGLELSVTRREAARFAEHVLVISRLVQSNLAIGRPGMADQHADTLERLALQAQVRLAAVENVCPDLIVLPGHGRSA